MCYNQTGDISTLKSSFLKLVDKLIYLGSSVSLIETDIDTRLTKAWTATNRLSVTWKSDQTDKMKRSFFWAAIVSILLYGCTTWTLTKRLEKKLDGNYRRMLRAILNRSWRQHPIKQMLYGHLRRITKTIQVRRSRHAGYTWRSRDELISDVLLWTSSHGRAKTGRPAWTKIQHLCEDTGCSPEDLSEAMNDWERWREGVRDINADGTAWLWYSYIYIYICVCVCVCVCMRMFISLYHFIYLSWFVLLSLSLSLSLTHTHTHTHTPSLCLSLSLYFSFYLVNYLFIYQLQSAEANFLADLHCFSMYFCLFSCTRACTHTDTHTDSHVLCMCMLQWVTQICRCTNSILLSVSVMWSC